MTNTSDIDIDKLARRILEMGGNAGVTQRCVPLASGGLSPDARVNYEFGLVLGVEEFRQEQFYHLQKSYLHNRALHGYGVVSGLQIALDRTSDNDIRVNVSTGVGVDQCGRTFIIRSDQCAYLRAWLERNRQSLNLDNGDHTLYVIGTYDECKDALVSIAGQPCASSEQSLAPSRIRDSFNITLSNEPPVMLAWETIRRLAALMTRVRIINGLPESESDELAITERVRVIDDPAALAGLDAPLAGYYGTDLPDYLKLPAEGINETLDRIFMVWVTEVRPRLSPTVIDGCGTSDPVETGILLGRLDFQIDDAGTPIQFSFSDATPTSSYDQRPYLMQTQAIQELLFLGVGNERKPARLFGSLFVQDDESLVLWVHHPETLAAPDTDTAADSALEVYVNGQRVQVSSIGATNSAGIRARNVFTIKLAENIPAAARVEVRFLLAGWRVTEDDVLEPAPIDLGGVVPDIRPLDTRGRATLPGDPERAVDLIDFERAARARTRDTGRNILEELRRLRLRTLGTTPLLASIDQFDFEYAERENDTIHLYAFAERLPEVRDLVVPTRRLAADVPQIRLWFPFDTPLNLDEVSEAGRALLVTDKATGQPLPFRVERTTDPHVWMLVAELVEGRGRAAALRRLIETLNNALVLLEFRASIITVAGRARDTQTLLAAMSAGQYSYTGFDGQDSIAVAYVPELPQAPPVQSVPTKSVPLANLQFMDINSDNTVTFELWFHLDLEWQKFDARVEDEFTMLVLAEVMENGQPTLVPFNFELQRVEDRPNVFEVLIFGGRLPERLKYLRFIFPVNEPMKITSGFGDFESLDKFMSTTGTRLENYYDIERFTERPAVVLYGRSIITREG
jgi:hypothetical protein